jgi:hypothetical protein
LGGGGVVLRTIELVPLEVFSPRIDPSTVLMRTHEAPVRLPAALPSLPIIAKEPWGLQGRHLSDVIIPWGHTTDFCMTQMARDVGGIIEGLSSQASGPRSDFPAPVQGRQ